MDGYIVSLDGSSAPASASAAADALHAGTMLWLELHGLDAALTDLLRDVFAFHPVALADAGEFHQRPKAENFGDMFYMVGYAATTVGGPVTEVHAFYTDRFLITVAQQGCDVLDEVRRRLEQHHSAVPPGRPPRLVLLHDILDAMIDSFFPPLSDLDDNIDTLIEGIFDQPSKGQLQELLSMQRWLVSVRKLVSPQRDGMAAVVSGVVDLPGRDASNEPYLRDLYDHIIRISEEIDSYRDLLDNAMDAYLSMVSNRLNEVMKQLTIIATVFLPLSFLTGFFGQNFSWLVEHLGGLPVFLILGIGTEVFAVAALYWLFRRRGWL
ncbi:MAG TPA: magnesium transporter CorA family protein [Streptosporangiaceae bacterium]|nr:magnesium transporter CorA family protein [Streptosporangiaceae bacterium]